MELFIRFAIFVSIVLLMLFWESRAPFRRFPQPKSQRIVVNFGLMALNFVVVRMFSAGGAFFIAEFAQQNRIGLFNLTVLPDWFVFVCSFLILDFAIYLQHRLFHKIPLLWRFHRVHHCDLGFDTTTGVRFHPLEILLSMYYKMAIVMALGIAPWAVMLFEIILNGCALFNHGNVQIADPWERRLRWLIITPDMHRVHHSTTRSETDSNFGFSISLWDRLCLSYCAIPARGKAGIEIGIPEERKIERLYFVRLLRLPFAQ